MARADTVSLTYTADIADLKKKLSEIPDITAAEARKAVNELTRTNRAIIQASKSAAGASRNAGDALKNLGDTAGDSESSLRAIGGVLGLISPQAERAVAMVAELGGGLEGVTKGARLAGVSMEAAVATMGLVGTAVIAAGAAYTAMTGEMERAAQHAKFLAEVNATLEPSVRRLEDAQLDLARATGAVSEAEAEATARSLDAQRAVLDFAAAQREQRAELRETIETQQRWLDGLGSLIGPAGRAIEWGADAVFGFSDSIADAEDKLRELDRAVQDEAAAQTKLRDVLEDTADAEERQAAATRSAASAAREHTQARHALLQEFAATATAYAQLQELTTDLAAADNEWSRRETAINDQLSARVELLDNIASQIGVTKEVNEAFLASAEYAEEKLLSLQQERHQAAMDGYRSRKKAAQAEMDALIDMQKEAGQATRSALMGLAQSSTEAINIMVEENSKISKESMTAAWRASAALAVSIIAIRAAEGYATASSLPPPANIFKAAEVTVSTGAALAAVAASGPPTFNDTPGVMQLQGGGTVAGANGDYVAMSKDLDDLAAQVDRARDAKTSAPPQVVAIPSYRGRLYGRARRDSYRRPGPDFDAARRDAPSGPGGW